MPEEAELVIPLLRMVQGPSVHLITYTAPVTKNMLYSCPLDYYALPSLPERHTFPEWLSIELGILGGRLYFTFAEYGPLRKYLHALALPFAHDGTSIQEALPATKFVAFILDWLSVRRKGQDIRLTPMGYLCQGKTLHEAHPFFRTIGGDGVNGTSQRHDVDNVNSEAED